MMPRRWLIEPKTFPGELGRAFDRDLHDRLEDLRLGLAVDLAEGADRGGLEGVVRGVDVVVLAVVQDDPDADDREADQLALLHGRLESLVAGGDELARDAAALDVVDELVDALGDSARCAR